MKALIYDTETTGLPDWNKPSEDPSQPRITQLCAELIDDESGEVLAGLHTLIKPDGWTIPPDLEKLTGITTEKAAAVGMHMWLALPVFMAMWERADQRVAHNESFDMRMVRIELLRDDRPKDADKWKAGKAFCTQNKSQAIINLPPTQKMIDSGRRGPKPPNLGEAYRHFTGTELLNAHNAAVDVMACKAVYFGIIKSVKEVA
jgi:DNA polymerase-3 subunit epsilon